LPGLTAWVSTKGRQAAGKVRRYALTRFRKEYVADQMALRVGECNQCGKCCEILFKCPFLAKVDDGTSYCTIYENRPSQCGAYPIDERCLAEVNSDCTFSFAKLPQEETQGLILLQIDPVGSSD
jgi:Fe-S-cluster containining protein